jgi:hypothetical protein
MIGEFYKNNKIHQQIHIFSIFKDYKIYKPSNVPKNNIFKIFNKSQITGKNKFLLLSTLEIMAI